jgi:hypothetical protein
LQWTQKSPLHKTVQRAIGLSDFDQWETNRQLLC